MSTSARSLLAGLSAVAAAPSARAEAVTSASAAEQLTQVLVALVVVIGVIVAAGWLARRVTRGPGAASSQFTVLGAMAIGPRERLMLIQLGDKQVLLGITPGQIRSLNTLDEPIALAPQPQAGDAPAPGFSKATFKMALARVLGGRHA